MKPKSENFTKLENLISISIEAACNIGNKISNFCVNLAKGIFTISNAITGGHGEDLIIINRVIDDGGSKIQVDANLNLRNILSFIIAQILSMGIGIACAWAIGVPLLMISGYSINSAIEVLIAITKSIMPFLFFIL